MKITPIEKNSALWLKIAREVTERLTSLRGMNDGNLDAMATAKVRGQIAMCKEVLGWATPNPEID